MSNVEYARAEDGTYVAYRVIDAKSPTEDVHLVIVSGGLFPMELFEDYPGFVRLLDGLSSFGRVVVFDRRGIGLSDPIIDWEQPILDQWTDDLAAVVDASGAKDAAVIAWDGYGIGARFAAQHPDRLRLLVLHHPSSIPDEQWDDWAAQRLASMNRNVEGVESSLLDQLAPSHTSDGEFLDWYARAGRAGASPTTAARIWESVLGARPDEQLLERIQTPTLVLHRRESVYAPADSVRRAASQISGATVVELDGADFFPFLGDVDAVVAEIADFVVGERRLPPPERILTALIFTDLVASTERAASMGDARWKTVLDRHDRTVRAAVGSCCGTVVKTTGDGVLALLPSVGAAVQAAERVRHDLTVDGLQVRIGIHVGDVDRRGDDISGLGVHVAARIMALAKPGEVLASASVPPAITSKTAAFEALGAHELKGVPGQWELFRLAKTVPDQP